MISPRERDMARMAEIRRLDAEREARRMGNVVEHNANVIANGVQVEKATREQNVLIERNSRAAKQKSQRISAARSKAPKKKAE